MVKLEVEIISKEIIKPSSPTPLHLHTLKFSFLDQLNPVLYNPIIIYYPVSNLDTKINYVLDHLKDSLSKTLSRFYPLAGRIRDHLYVDCNDEGVEFYQTKVNCHFSDFLKQPKTDILEQFLPYPGLSFLPFEPEVQVGVQVNIFASGGIAIGVCFLHKLVDGNTMSAFLRTWAAIARGDEEKAIFPDFTKGPELFPPRESPFNPLEIGMFKPQWSINFQSKGIRKRFVFNAAAISKLKEEAKSKLVPHPSSVAVVTSFIWKHAMAASKKLSSPELNYPSVMAFSVNTRPRRTNPLPDSYTGNMVWPAMSRHHASLPNEEIKLQDLVSTLCKGIGKINEDFLGKINGDNVELLHNFKHEVAQMFAEEKQDMYLFSSWCKFGFEEVDFGWGKPIWASIMGGVVNPLINFNLILLDSCSGNGIEAWTLLDENQMALLESDEEFLKFAFLNPSICIPETR